ncbi:hypothetical protein [Exiguobacterium sp. s142]|uniref:hypothetical protein n=1 Tax=Exiguobacterium sp. s142 TaxID=2751222 RepID=UPI001BEA509D|nr:hypothetical protein [Exiguobacterium sp. s142]
MQWIAFAIAILPSSGLVIAMVNGIYLSREDIRVILAIFYGVSIVTVLISLFLPKRVDKQ